MQSVPITTKVASSNPVHGQVYSIQHYVIKFVSQRFSPVSSTNKTVRHEITEILLKVALNSPPPQYINIYVCSDMKMRPHGVLGLVDLRIKHLCMLMLR